MNECILHVLLPVISYLLFNFVYVKQNQDRNKTNKETKKKSVGDGSGYWGQWDSIELLI